MPNIVAPDVDRLPWLNDDPVRRPRRSGGFVVPFLAASAVALIAAASYWLGLSGSLNFQRPVQTSPEASVVLPPASQVEVPLAPQMPQVDLVTDPAPVALPVPKQVRIEAPAVQRASARPAAAVHHAKAKPTVVAAKEESTLAKKGLQYTSPWESKGVSGRMVRVGAYGTLDEGKQAWSRLAKLSPAIRQLPAVVTDLPSRNGKVYYWLQIGTTSQAHSEVLCQRMRAIRQSCVVVDLAGARKGSGNERQPVGV